MRRLATSLLLVLLASVPLAVCAQVYTWTDANGTVHYSDSPPAHGTKYKDVHMNGTASTPASQPQKPDDGSAADSDKSDEAAPDTPPTRIADTPANRKKLCDNITANLKLLQKDSPVIIKDAKGQNQVLSKDQRKQETAKMQQQYQKYCKA